MQTILQDLRYALRQTRHAPGFAFAVVLVLALGIGANAAMFTVLEGTLFRPLPYKHASELVQITATSSRGIPVSLTLPDVLVWQARSHTLSQIAYFDNSWAYLNSQEATGNVIEQKVTAVSASSNLFATLGAIPMLGHSFTAEEQQPGKEHVVLLSDYLWRTQFHSDRSILGRSVRIDGTPSTVIGIMPPGFIFPADSSPAQLWEPTPLLPVTWTRSLSDQLGVLIARRVAGITVPAVESELNTIQKQLVPLYTGKLKADLAPSHVEAVDYSRSLNTKDQRMALLALMGAVALLWLIACANVACLMLARSTARRREMAVRAALGASRWCLVRQNLTESLLLSLAGGVFGLVLSQITLGLFRHSIATQLDLPLALHPDARVLLALFGLSMLSATLFGILPSWLASGTALDQALRQDGTQGGTGRHQQRLQRILVVSELSLTLALLVSCGLLLRTVFALHHVPLGFHTDHVFVIEPHLPGYKYQKLDPNTILYRPLLDRIKEIPGVQTAAITTIAPLIKGFNAQFALYVGGGKRSGEPDILVARLRASGPELQKVLGFSMQRGRYFDAQDTADSPPVAVVNQAFAKLYEPAVGDVIGFHVGNSKDLPINIPGMKDRPIRIVGIIDDFHQAGIADPAEPEIDLNAAQERPTDTYYRPTLKAHVEIVLRSSRDARSLIPELNHVMQQFNPDLTGADIRTMNQIVDDAMGSQILAAHLLEALGGLALLIALAGLYSLLTYLVTLRTRELGLRLALGAQHEDIFTLVLRGAAVLLLTGTVIGTLISLLTVHLLHTFLFGVTQYDALTLITASTLLLLVGTLAAWLPARRAAALEPMQALRME